MALLLLDRANLHIKTDGDALALYEAGERTGTVPIKLIDRCIIHGQRTQMDSGMLLKLAEVGATTVILSPRQHRRHALILGPQHNDAAVRLAQARCVLDADWCQQWAVQILRAKLRRQARALQRWLKERPDERKPLFDAHQSVQTALQTLAAAHPAPAPERLRGIEGAAARAYFAGFAAVLPPAMQFTGRNRRPPRDPVNACLSLGYTLLHAQAVQACHIAGLDPLLGFYHRPAIGRESLASDLIEPLRAEIDHWVWQLMRTRELREHHFNQDNGACLLGKEGRGIFYARWQSQQHAAPWQRWLRLQTRALARQMRQQGQPLLARDADDEWEEEC